MLVEGLEGYAEWAPVSYGEKMWGDVRSGGPKVGATLIDFSVRSPITGPPPS